MSNNGPIVVTSGVTPLSSASGSQLIFTTKYPFAKLDTTNKVSFQVISILLTKDTPNPASSNTVYYEPVVTIPHGYTYVPSTWALISLDGFSTVFGQEGVTFYTGTPYIGNNNSTGKINITADATNVYIVIAKYWSSNDAQPPNFIGTSFTIRLYVFVEDLTATSIPANP